MRFLPRAHERRFLGQVHNIPIAYPPSLIALAVAFVGLMATTLLYMMVKEKVSFETRRVLWGIVFAEVFAVFGLLTWQTLPILRDEAESSTSSHYLCPLQFTAFLVSMLALMFGVGLSATLLPRYQGHPMVAPSSDGAGDASENGTTLPACFAGRWFDEEVSAAKSFVCQSRVPERARYFRPNLTMGFEAASAHCEQRDAHLPFVDSWAASARVRSVCGSRECWIGIEQRAVMWRYLDGTATRFSNWQSAPTDTGNAKAVAINSEAFCRSGAFAAGPELHLAVAHMIFPLSLALGVPTILGAMCMLSLARMGVQFQDEAALECVQRCDGAGMWWTAGLGALACCALTAALILLLPGSHGGTLPGGPVLCAVDGAHLGFGSRRACERGFLAALCALLGAMVLLHAVQALLCRLGRRAAGRLLEKERDAEEGQSASLTRLATPGASSSEGDEVIGMPILSRGPSLVAPLGSSGRDPWSASWDPGLPLLLERLRSSTAAESPRGAFERYAQAAPTLAPVQFESLLRDWEPSISNTSVASFWQAADADHDGQLTFEEFLHFLKPGGAGTTGTDDEEEAGAPLPPSSALPALLGAGSSRAVRVTL